MLGTEPFKMMVTSAYHAGQKKNPAYEVSSVPDTLSLSVHHFPKLTGAVAH
jgi:hypothetical protein